MERAHGRRWSWNPWNCSLFFKAASLVILEKLERSQDMLPGNLMGVPNKPKTAVKLALKFRTLHNGFKGGPRGFRVSFRPQMGNQGSGEVVEVEASNRFVKMSLWGYWKRPCNGLEGHDNSRVVSPGRAWKIFRGFSSTWIFRRTSDGGEFWILDLGWFLLGRKEILPQFGEVKIRKKIGCFFSEWIESN